jgi:hypothetical protein
MSRAKPPSASALEIERVATFFRTLAARAEADPAFASAVRAALEESGLLETDSVRKSARPRSGKRTLDRGALQPLDPFVVYRDHGEAALRTALEAMDVQALRALVRAHRLDPARISARWIAADRLIALIVQQVQARVSIGKAFAHV